MASGADIIHIGKARDAAQMGNAARMHHGGADIVDQLLFDQLFTVPDRIENFADSNWRGGVLPDQPETRLIFGRRRVFQPEWAIRLQIFAQPSGFDRRQPVVDVVEQMDVHSARGRDKKRMANVSEN